MTWEETIKYIRQKPEYRDLVRDAYFEENLPINVERFRVSEEYLATRDLIRQYCSFDSSTRVLDIGSGNGISAIAFALDGLQVTTVEPDPSETIGAGAIKKLKEHYKLSNIHIFEKFAEDLQLPSDSFDIVYARQCMHHAHDLQKFMNECYRVLKKNGILVTVRDHVVYNPKDKQWFLESHPLQRFYGGENAFTPEEYQGAMRGAGFIMEKVLKHFDSVINYFPLSKQQKEEQDNKVDILVNSIVSKKLGFLDNIRPLHRLAENHVRKTIQSPFKEEEFPGRLYTFVCLKK